jgi:hypothetical protein
MVDVPMLDAYFTILLMAFGGGVGIMMKVRNQDINRIEKKIDNLIEHLNMATSMEIQQLTDINASLRTIIEFMKNGK